MSLSFEDFEKDYPSSEPQKQQAESAKSVVKNTPSGVSPTVSQTWDKASPVIQSGLERAINPFHYKGDQEDYTTIDWPLSAAHAGAEAVVGKRLWDFATGKSSERETEKLKAEQFKRQNDIAEANAAARNSAQQGVAPQLSPLDQAKIETEQARAEAIKKQIAINEAKAARDEAEAKARSEAKQAKQASATKQANPAASMKESEVGMVAASEDAKLGKAVAADQKAQVTRAAVPQVAAQAAVAPPTVQLTPTPEVVAEGVPTVEKQTVKGSVSPSKTIPEGQVFKEGLGSGDNWLYNTYGAEGRKAILNQFNEGKPAGSYEEALALSKKAQEAKPGPQIPREVARERGIAPPETNYGKLGKTAKVAGAAGLLMTAAQAANAAQEAKKGNAAPGNEFLFNLLGAIPGLGTAFNAATYSGGLGEGEQQELAKRRGMAPTIR